MTNKEQIKALKSVMKQFIDDYERIFNEEQDESMTAVEGANLSLEDVRKVLAEKSKDGYRAEVKSLIQSFGAERLSDIAESDYVSLYEKAKGIKDA